MKVVRKAVFEGHKAAIYALAALDGLDDGSVYTGDGEGVVVRWQPAHSNDGVLYAQVPETVFSLLFLPTQNKAMIGTIHGNLYAVDAVSHQLLKTVAAHRKGIFRLFWLRNTLYSLGGDGKLTTWEMSVLLPKETLHLSQKSLRGYAYNGKNDLAITAADGTIFVVDTLLMQVTHTLLQAHAPSAFTVAYSPCGKYLMSGGRDALLKIWTVADYTLYHVIPAHIATINDLVFAPSGNFFATASRDKTIKIWHAQTFALLKVLDSKYGGHTRSVNQIRFGNDNTLYSVSDDRTLIQWEIIAETAD